MDKIFESERLCFRRIATADFPELQLIFKDGDTMYAWEQAFTDDEIGEWIDKNQYRYEKDGFSYFAAVEKESGKLVGVIGPLMEQMTGIVWDESTALGQSLKQLPDRPDEFGIAYILNRMYWKQGYALEGARSSLMYTLDVLCADRVIAQIRPDNTASRKVAEKLGMTVAGRLVKTFKGKEMPHLIYCLTRDGYERVYVR